MEAYAVKVSSSEAQVAEEKMSKEFTKPTLLEKGFQQFEIVLK